MKKHNAVIVAIAMGVLPIAAFAQSRSGSGGEAAYCNRLADTYTRYVGHEESGGPGRLVRRGTTDGQVAVAQCHEGKTASAIPVLERELRRAGFTLPARG
jgi:hypothetical protein